MEAAAVSTAARDSDVTVSAVGMDLGTKRDTVRTTAERKKRDKDKAKASERKARRKEERKAKSNSGKGK